MSILPPSPSASEAVVMANTPKIYKIGSLRYTLRGLFILFAWLLGGDFAFTFFESVFGRFLPLYMNDLHASNSLIGIMVGSIAGGVNLLFLPSISQWSDRCRTPFGRRIPFLAVAAPGTAVALILLGYAPDLGGWLHRRVTVHFVPTISETTVILTLLCVFVAFWHFCNMVLINAYYWLMREVVPHELMGRFLSWLRLVSTAGSILFSWYVFPHLLIHLREVCVVVALCYLVVFFLMCWKVKEGEYPPPPVQENKPGIFKTYVLYFRECFAVPLYRYYFFAGMLGAFGNSSTPFFLLFYRNTLHLSMDDLGKIFSLGSLVTFLALLPVGWLCDKFTPFRVMIVVQGGMFLLNILSFFLINDEKTLVIFTVVTSIVAVGGGLAGSTINMKLFPTEKYAQFSSAGGVIGMATSILSNYLIGAFMDFSGSNYRLAYLWFAISSLGIIPLLLVYRGWKAHGGPDHYVAPLPD